MKINKNILIILLIVTVISCHNNDTNTSTSSSSKTTTDASTNLFSAYINGTKTSDQSPLVLLNKHSNGDRESINISGVFNDLNSHIGLLVASEKGPLHTGNYPIQSNSTIETNARYETNVNGGTTPVDNTLYNGTGNIIITKFDTSTKRIIATVEMDGANKINQKVHITGQVNSSYK